MSKILGIKLTHDGAVALIDDGKLLFSIEMEKLKNNPRYSAITNLQQIEQVLADEGVDVESIDGFVVDGWKGGRIQSPLKLDVAPYHEHDSWWPDMLESEQCLLKLGGKERGFNSYTHVTGHIMGAYMTAPFAGQEAYCVVMDGGIPPRLYQVDSTGIKFIKTLSKLNGLLYGIMGYYAGPFRRDELISGALVPTTSMQLFGGREVPGKLMSWIAKGKPQPHILSEAKWIYDGLPDNGDEFDQSSIPEHDFMFKLRRNCQMATDEDILASVHEFIEDQLVRSVCAHTQEGHSLIFVGGSALNIKWNSALRDCDHFSEVWVPPFTNDSGSAIGQAAAEAFACDGIIKLDWNVYRGPRLNHDVNHPDWMRTDCSIQQLAKLLATSAKEPVVFLHGRAEIGPRALGHRSIIMSPTSPYGQDVLNHIKGRESWRPVAPIALEEDAAEIFSPGTPDPYMLFDHSVNHEWREKIPAVVHLDGTARLQTIGDDDCSVVRELLYEFKKLTGIGVLCNTSANMNGSGFFPDVQSAMQWGKCRHIWNDGNLYCKIR